TWQTVAGVAPQWQTVWQVPPADKEPYVLLSRATDVVGRVVTSAPVTVAVDTVGPALHVHTPTAGQLITGTHVITGTASDGSAPGYVQLSFNGGNSWVLAAGTAVWSYTWQPASLDGITQTIHVRGGDTAANVTTTAVTVTVDNTPPDSIITLPANGALVTGTVTTVAGTAVDGSGINRVELSFDNQATWHAALGQETWTYTWTLPAANGLQLPIYSRAVDAAGHVQQPPTEHWVTIDNRPPGIQITTPAPDSYLSASTVTIRGTADDVMAAGRALAQVEVSTDAGASWHAASGATAWYYVWALPPDEDGVSHTILARATDTAGYSTLSAPLTVTVDRVRPTVVATWPPPDAQDVALDAAIIITFSEPIDVSTLSVGISPQVTQWIDDGPPFRQVVTIHHDPFAFLTDYTLRAVQGRDRGGNYLVYYEWGFYCGTSRRVYLPVAVRPR
ncbi:MAG: Ig-like domain-containing protein, partial [Anaerolineales bacterium]|nr:Ig-like domain-containing protein [Anaerolineales bacterium]